MNDDEEREEVVFTRRKGDPTKPTISDVTIAGKPLPTPIVILERPRTPLEKDYVEGAAHPCIEPGAYDVNWTENVHPKHPFCYQVITGPGTPAPDRSDILQHTANWIRELAGCQAPGLTAQVVEGVYKEQYVKEYGVTASGPALGQFLDVLCRKNYRLIIKEAA